MSRSVEEMLEVVRDVEGWMSDDQARRLDAAARTAVSGDRIVEIGSFRGRSTIVLANAAADGVEVVAIDPHAGNDRGPGEMEGYAVQADDDHRVFLANLEAAGVAARVRHVRAFSQAAQGAVVGDVAVLYIDGAHRFGPARSDIREWGARVAPGGTLLIHDAFSSVGVTLAILAELVPSDRFRYVGRSRSLVEYRADLGGGRRDRIVDALRQLAQLPWFLKNVTLKVMLTLRLGPLLRRLTGRVPEWPY